MKNLNVTKLELDALDDISHARPVADPAVLKAVLGRRWATLHSDRYNQTSYRLTDAGWSIWGEYKDGAITPTLEHLSEVRPGPVRKHADNAARTAAYRERKRLAQIEADRIERERIQAEKEKAEARASEQFVQFVRSLPAAQQGKILATGGWQRWRFATVSDFVRLTIPLADRESL